MNNEDVMGQQAQTFVAYFSQLEEKDQYISDIKCSL